MTPPSGVSQSSDSNSPPGDRFERRLSTVSQDPSPTQTSFSTALPNANSSSPLSAASLGTPMVHSVKSTLIHFDETQKTFKLANNRMGYYLHVNPDGELINLHWGKPVGEIDSSLINRHLTPVNSWQHPLDILPREYPDYGRGDNRTPAIKVTTASGSSISRFKYLGHSIMPGKPELEGVPSLKASASAGKETQTLAIRLYDDVNQLEMEQLYTVFPDSNALARSARIINKGNEPVQIDKIASISTDFRPDDYRLLKLSGAWTRENQEELVALKPGSFSVSSNMGASGHRQNPFVALLPDETTEREGNAYGFSLAYSGSFQVEAEQTTAKNVRVVMGLNPESFKWKLAPGESFQTPEAIGVFSSKGVEGITRQMHQIVQSQMVRGEWQNKQRPVLLNTWEAVYFNFDHNRIMQIAKDAKDLGVELLVLDDGWFGRKYPRNDDTAGLGDWIENPAKLTHGLKGLGEEINKMGMMFGIWVEPEMVNPRSELYEQHPDWVLHQPGRLRTELRNQLVLDMGRKEVQDYVIDSMSKILDTGHVQYVKWDMNRYMTEVGSAALPADRQMETQHRYMLGLYRVLDTLTQKYPDVLFEGCASGGGRFDPGMLRYFPQIWTSDNTDALSRLNIQAGTARAYPIKTMGAHVSDVPNHQVGRNTSLKFRFHSAMSANLGLELDPTKMSNEEKVFARQEIERYKNIRHLVQEGQYQQLRSPFKNNWPAWMFQDQSGSEAVVFAFQKLAEPAIAIPNIKLKDLEEKALYQVEGYEKPFSGAYLMEIGLTPQFNGDFDSQLFHLKKMSEEAGISK